jgi:ribosome-associated heat shock protein Hsp15
MSKSTASEKSSELRRLRLDKWLWAARFYKTRSVAKQAIDGGKVYCEGGRCKALSEQRRGAPEAQLLYEETQESTKTRLEQAAQRKAQPSLGPSAGKPNKKDRRLIHRFKQI